MRSEIKQWFEMLTCGFLKLFLPQRPHNAPPFSPSALPNPSVVLPECPRSDLTLEKFFQISFLETLTLDTLAPDLRSAQVHPILHANHPIRHGKRPILPANHPILLSNHPRFSRWGPHSEGVKVASGKVARYLAGGQAFRLRGGRNAPACAKPAPAGIGRSAESLLPVIH